MSLIECRGLERTYRRGSEEIKPLEDLDLDIESGRFVALMGPSGSGKTTLLNLLAGIDRPTAGSLVVDGREVHRLSGGTLARWRSESVGYVFQLYNLVPVLSAYENVELPLLLHGILHIPLVFLPNRIQEGIGNALMVALLARDAVEVGVARAAVVRAAPASVAVRRAPRDAAI